MQSSSRSTAAKASVTQKEHQRHDSSGEREYTAYVNTHLRRSAYNPPPSSSSQQQQAGLEDDDDDEEGQDDEQGAQWEEWDSERRNEWMEGRLRDFFPDIQAAYVLPTAGRVDSGADVAVFEGAAGVAYTFFHTAVKILRALPPDTLSLALTQAQTPVAKARRLDSDRHRPSHSPSGRVRDLTVPSPSSAEQQPSPRAAAEIRAEQQLHSQRQHCIALLQHAYDYIQYCLQLVDEQQGEKAADSASSNLSREDRKQIRSCDSRISFIRGKAGIFSLAACIHHHRARYLLLHPHTLNLPSPHFDPQSCLQQRADSISRLLQERHRCDDGDEVDDEFFNGRAGFLFALNFLYSHLTGEVERMQAADAAGAHSGSRASDAGGDDSKDQPAPTEQSVMDVDTLKRQLAEVKAAIQSVHQQLIARGKQQDDSSVLRYTWQGKEYYGAAHGTAGILHALLQSPASVLKPSLPIIVSTASFLLSQRLPSGNFPSSASSTSDRLVQWCHGAPALSLLCSSLYAVTRDRQWLQAALECAEVVWQRGLLKKGVGLCHGISGNGYCFLTLYQLTRDSVQLHRAYHFAHFAMSDHHAQLMKQPDQPYSLYNGLAGLVCFCVDIEQSSRTCPSFPGYQLLDWGMTSQD